MKQAWSDITDTYKAGWSFAWAFPVLFLIPVLAEFSQHCAEIWIGMYENTDAFGESAEHPMRLVFGALKGIAISLPSYWFVRFLWGRDGSADIPMFESRSFKLWGLVFLYLTLGLVVGLCLPSFLVGLNISTVNRQVFLAGFFLILTVVGIYLTVWVVAWPLGNKKLGPLRSFGLMRGSFLRAIVYLIGAILVYMPIHYGLGYLAIGSSPIALWILLGLDSLVVGFLALNLSGVYYFIARWALRCNGEFLLPDSPTQHPR